MEFMNIYKFILACEVEAGSTLVRDNVIIGFIGLGVIVIALVLQIIINKHLFKRVLPKSLIMYMIMFVIQGLLAFTTGMGDCGYTFAGGTIAFSIMSAFWLIFITLITYAMTKSNIGKKSTPPFAKPDRK